MRLLLDELQVQKKIMKNHVFMLGKNCLNETGMAAAKQDAKKFYAMMKAYGGKCTQEDKKIKNCLLDPNTRETNRKLLEECKEMMVSKEMLISYDVDGSPMKDDISTTQNTVLEKDIQKFVSDANALSDAMRKREIDRDATKADKNETETENDAKSGEKRKADETDEEADETDEDEQHEIGHIVSVMIDSRGKVFFECYWDGYTHSENTFEPLSNLGPFGALLSLCCNTIVVHCSLYISEAEGKRLIEKVEKVSNLAPGIT